MKKPLEDALCAAYPAIFRQKDLPVTESSMSHIWCEEGWYAIIEGLCAVLSAHGRRDGHPPVEAAQVKQKLAGLRFYLDHRLSDGRCCEWCHGAVEFAQTISFHVCEQTGRPGVPMAGRGYRTLAKDVGRAMGYRRPAKSECLPMPALPAVDDGVPPGWRTIAGVLTFKANERLSDAKIRFGQAGGGLTVDARTDDDFLSGAIACAKALALRTDPATGIMRIPRAQADPE